MHCIDLVSRPSSSLIGSVSRRSSSFAIGRPGTLEQLEAESATSYGGKTTSSEFRQWCGIAFLFAIDACPGPTVLLDHFCITNDEANSADTGNVGGVDECIFSRHAQTFSHLGTYCYSPKDQTNDGSSYYALRYPQTAKPATVIYNSVHVGCSVWSSS